MLGLKNPPKSTLYVQGKVKDALLTFHLLTRLCKGQVSFQAGTLPSDWYFFIGLRYTRLKHFIVQK